MDITVQYRTLHLLQSP